MPESLTSDVKKVEDAIKKRVCVSTHVSIGKLMEEFQARFSEGVIALALRNMVINQEFK